MCEVAHVFCALAQTVGHAALACVAICPTQSIHQLETGISCVLFVQLTRHGYTDKHKIWSTIHPVPDFRYAVRPLVIASHRLSHKSFTWHSGNAWHCFLHALTKPLSF